MNTETFQSIARAARRDGQRLCAAVLLAGVIFAGLGEWGTYYFGSKSAQEKEKDRALQEQQFHEELSSLEKKYEELRDGAKTLEPSPLQPGIAKQKPAHKEPPKTTPPQLAGTAPQPLITVAEAKTTPAPVTSHPVAVVSKPQARRNLSDKQRQEIVDVLRKYAGKTITICSVESDTEGFAFAGTLKHVFEDAGWHVDGVKQVSYAKPPVGLNLATGSFPSPEGLVATYLAFTSAGFNVSQQLDAKLTGGQAELIVGAMQ